MEGERKILLIRQTDENEFEQYFTEQMKKYEVDIIDPYKSYLAGTSKVKKLVHLLECTMGYKFNGLLKKYDTIIVFDLWMLIPFLNFSKSKGTKLVLWRWNTANTSEVLQIQKVKNKCEIWTFDPKEASSYGWKWNTQFYFKQKTECTDIENEEMAFFCGIDKGRYETLSLLKGKLDEYQVKSNFYIQKDASSREEGNIPLKSTLMPYKKVLENVIGSKYVVDITKENQEGITLRVMESVFYKKKLITNNKKVKSLDLYKAANVFVIDDDQWDTFSDFMEKPLCEIDENVLNKYDFKEWLLRF